MTLKVFNIEKGLHHFLETVKCFNFEKWLHHILMSLKVFQDSYSVECWWTSASEGCLSYHTCVLVDRNFDFLGGYCLLPSGYYWLLVVTWWLLLVTGGYCSLLVVTARYRSLLLVPTFTMNGQKFRSNFNGKYILFQKIGILSQQQPNFTSSYEKHGGINSSTSSSKKIIFQTKNSTVYPSREDKGISPCLETTHKRSRALGFSSRLPWLPNSSPNGTSTGEVSKATKVKSGTTKTRRSGCEGNAGKGSISTVFNSTFLSSLFLISKKGGGNRPVINLKDPNRFSPYKHF